MREKLFMLNAYLGRHAALVGLCLSIIGYGGLWYFYGFKAAFLVWIVIFANNLEQSGNREK